MIRFLLMGGFLLGGSQFSLETNGDRLYSKATIEIAPFFKAKHDVRLRPYSGGIQRIYIDGKTAWGMEATDVIEYPRLELASIHLLVGKRKITLPKSAFSDFYNPHEDKSTWWLWSSKKKDSVVLKMLASDGTGAYRALWRIKSDGTWKRNVQWKD